MVQAASKACTPMLTPSANPRRAHLFWTGLYFLLGLAWIRFDQFAYWHDPFTYQPVLAGTGCAPEQYRTAMPHLAQWLAEHLHLHSLVAGLLVVDFINVLALAVLLYALLLRQLRFAPAQIGTTAKALLGLLLVFYLHQTYAFARVETLPNCVFVALALLLIGNMEGGASRVAVLSGLGLCVLGFAEGWVRADVAVVLGVALVLGALFATDIGGRVRGTLMGVGLLVAGVSGATLLYLMRVAYPAAHYCGAVFTLGFNFGLSYNYLGLLTVIPPVVVALVVLLRRFGGLAVADRTILIAAVLYLGVWSVLGNWSEPRIYIPFAMGLLPVACAALAQWTLRNEPGP
jgi:hypothetical protein